MGRVHGESLANILYQKLLLRSTELKAYQKEKAYFVIILI